MISITISILIIIILFVIYYIIRGNLICPCPSKHNKNYCYRTELYGLQLNHLIFYIIIGYLYPKHFITWQILGIIWELFELLPTYLPNIFLPYMGGCIQKDKVDKFYINILDRWIPRNKEHFWHPKLTDILLNIIGYLIGYSFV